MIAILLLVLLVVFLAGGTMNYGRWGAGGLSPANVSQAIEAVAPFGVDVSSGVEEAPGRKSPELIESFASRAREAFARARTGERR